jgi:hypothetical protein
MATKRWARFPTEALSLSFLRRIREAGHSAPFSTEIKNASNYTSKPPIHIEYFIYSHVSGVCVTNNTGFGFADRIYWTFIQLVTTVHKSLTDTLSSSSDWTLHWNYSDFQLSCQLLSSRYITTSRTTAYRTHPLPSNGYI